MKESKQQFNILISRDRQAKKKILDIINLLYIYRIESFKKEEGFNNDDKNRSIDGDSDKFFSSIEIEIERVHVGVCRCVFYFFKKKRKKKGKNSSCQ